MAMKRVLVQVPDIMFKQVISLSGGGGFSKAVREGLALWLEAKGGVASVGVPVGAAVSNDGHGGGLKHLVGGVTEGDERLPGKEDLVAGGGEIEEAPVEGAADQFQPHDLILEEKQAVVRDILAKKERPTNKVSAPRIEETPQSCPSCGTTLAEKVDPRSRKILMVCPFCAL